MTSSINSTSTAAPTSFLSAQLAGLTVNVEGDYTRGAVVNSYSDQVDNYATALSFADKSPTAPQLAALAALLTSSTSSLITLARDGITQLSDPNSPPGPNNPSTAFYLTQSMVNNLDQLFQSLQIAGATITAHSSGPPTVSISAANVRRWLDLSLVSPVVGQLVNTAQSLTDGATHSIQAFTELVYVRTANEVLESQMVGLEQALQVTQSTLKTLQDVQDLHNQVSLTSITTLDVPKGTEVNPPNNIDAWETEYLKRANEALVPIGIQIDDTKTGVTRDLPAEMQAAQNQLTSDLAVLATVAGTESAIFQRTQTVLQELEAANNPTNPSAFAAWFADGYTGGQNGGATEGSGAIQSNINAAISSTQAFNDSESQNVSNSMFVFEEYYKSASAVLDKLSQIIEKIAQNISR